MKVQYCSMYEKYVSVHHCEFFNEGKACPYYSTVHWERIKDLMADRKRPKRDVNGIIKPFHCSLIGRRSRHLPTRSS